MTNIDNFVKARPITYTQIPGTKVILVSGYPRSGKADYALRIFMNKMAGYPHVTYELTLTEMWKKCKSTPLYKKIPQHYHKQLRETFPIACYIDLKRFKEKSLPAVHIVHDVIIRGCIMLYSEVTNSYYKKMTKLMLYNGLGEIDHFTHTQKSVIDNVLDDVKHHDTMESMEKWFETQVDQVEDYIICIVDKQMQLAFSCREDPTLEVTMHDFQNALLFSMHLVTHNPDVDEEASDCFFVHKNKTTKLFQKCCKEKISFSMK